jgi:hypothetical protein
MVFRRPAWLNIRESLRSHLYGTFSEPFYLYVIEDSMGMVHDGISLKGLSVSWWLAICVLSLHKRPLG